MDDIIRAKFTPRDLTKWDTRTIECCAGKEKIYNFKYAYNIKGEDYLEPIDKNFPSGNPVCIKDLTIIEVKPIDP